VSLHGAHDSSEQVLVGAKWVKVGEGLCWGGGGGVSQWVRD
jgi:hypothetical protein